MLGATRSMRFISERAPSIGSLGTLAVLLSGGDEDQAPGEARKPGTGEARKPDSSARRRPARRGQLGHAETGKARKPGTGAEDSKAQRPARRGQQRGADCRHTTQPHSWSRKVANSWRSVSADRLGHSGVASFLTQIHHQARIHHRKVKTIARVGEFLVLIGLA